MSLQAETVNVRVWRVNPDPDGIFDVLIVDSADAAGEAAARAAELLWDEAPSNPAEPGPAVTITVCEMPRVDFEQLPEPY